ncbi:MAG: hypothetical protein LBK83_04225 [Treponema sp.]|jgi:hypothetical protein|nr:hypothetical protein [Treponema sp.]
MKGRAGKIMAMMLIRKDSKTHAAAGRIHAMKKIIFFIFCPILILSHCTSGTVVKIGPLLFEKYYKYYTENEKPNMYYNGVIQVLNTKSDLDDIPEFTPYMINDTLFVLDTNPQLGTYIDNSDVEDNDLALARLRLFIFTKNKSEDLSYKIKKMVLHTSEYVKDFEELRFEWDDRPHARETDLLDFINDEYRSAIIVGGYLLFPRPKNMKMSIYLEVEINEDNTISSHSFVYHYNLKLIKGWLQLLS